MLSQKAKDFEHILVDNQSSDDTLKIAKQLYDEHKLSEKLKIISERDEGISDAFNKGIKAADGDIIAILNSATSIQTLLKALVEVLKKASISFC